MARPAKGSLRWNATAKAWEVRVTKADGSRSKPIVMTGLPPCAVVPAEPPRACTCSPCTVAAENARLVSDRVRSGAAVDAATDETANEWLARYIAHAKAIGQTDTRTKRSRWEKWIAPRLGHKPMAAVTRNDVEDVRDALDVAILAWTSKGRALDRVSGKTAMNVWSCLTSSFKAATNSKRRDLRVLEGLPNPCVGVLPPGDPATRKARRKTFVYPREADLVFACEAIPVEWRRVHAIAARSALRPGELRVLTFGDLELDASVIHVTKAWDYADEIVKTPKTANGVRRVPVDPYLVTLLRSMAEGQPATALVMPIMSDVKDNTLATIFREHLKTAGIKRPELTASSRTNAIANFRTWRDSGLTWLAMTGLGVDKICRRAGHDQIQTTMGYVKQAEDLSGDLGLPFGPLPATLSSSGGVSVFRSAGSNDPVDLRRRARDSNPWEACTST